MYPDKSSKKIAKKYWVKKYGWASFADPIADSAGSRFEVATCDQQKSETKIRTKLRNFLKRFCVISKSLAKDNQNKKMIEEYFANNFPRKPEHLQFWKDFFLKT